jgi:succinate dehydrogenase hydrophobic anchor subunit
LPAFLVIAVSVVLSLILAWLDAKSLIRKYKEGEKTKLILAMSLFLVFFIVSLFISFFLLIVINN